MKRAVIGIVAHVDAGKTTLSEAMLYVSGSREKLGRVDKRDSFLDTHDVERERGITVFSKQAVMKIGSTELTLIDTPGHVDFSSETERSLSIQDYSVLVVSAPEGITPHTMTLYHLISKRKIPTFIFVNKTDIADRKRRDILDELKRAFGTGVVDFNLEKEDLPRFLEECAAADENLMEDFFEKGIIPEEKIALSIKKRRIIPAFFGSALKCEKIDIFLSAIDRYTLKKRYSDTLLGAKVYKIGTDPSGARLTYLKVTGGKISIKDTINYVGAGGKLFSEKVEGIRLYSADKFKALKCAEAGMTVALTGLTKTSAGLGIGTECESSTTLEAPLDYKMTFLNKDCDVYRAYLDIAPLAEEDPALHLRYDSASCEIKVKLMGEIQTEVLARVIKDRFGYDVSFDDGSILYKETISEKVFGAGHFEPLMHYAEVRLRLEPLPYGSGLVFTSDCPSDRLKTNWQRLILSHLEEREHKGTLTGSPITDMKITLIAGRAHPKHTEGGDFREAAYRALRQGLMKADIILLEPIFDFVIELPQDMLGRAMTDISSMSGEYSPPEFTESTARLSGTCPVSTMRGYAGELRSYTRGAGKLTVTSGGYAPCHNAEEVISAFGYSPELDSSITADSVFCKGGSGYSVPWYESDEKMHTENPEEVRTPTADEHMQRRVSSSYKGTIDEDKELMKIFESTYGKIKRRIAPEKRENSVPEEKTSHKRSKPRDNGEEYIIVDGYNLIFAWDRLKKLAAAELAHARDTLIHIMSNYRGFKKCNLILVFDAYKRRDNDGAVEECGGITVVYTKERQTADAYIERAAYDLAPKNTVKVVTSDYEEQLVILGVGGIRVPAREFIEEVEAVTNLELYGI